MNKKSLKKIKLSFCSKLQFALKDLDPDKTVNDERFPKDFIIEVIKFVDQHQISQIILKKVLLSDYCNCNSTSLFNEKCGECKPYLEQERKSWEIIYEIMDVETIKYINSIFCLEFQTKRFFDKSNFIVRRARI